MAPVATVVTAVGFVAIDALDPVRATRRLTTRRTCLTEIRPLLYGTIVDHKDGAIIGFSMGRRHAGRFGLRHLETFSAVGIISAGLGGGEPGRWCSRGAALK